MPKAITFTADPDLYNRQPILVGAHLIRRMRELGVPVVGDLWPICVESGVLSVTAPDLSTGEVTWRWEP